MYLRKPNSSRLFLGGMSDFPMNFISIDYFSDLQQSRIQGGRAWGGALSNYLKDAVPFSRRTI